MPDPASRLRIEIRLAAAGRQPFNMTESPSFDYGFTLSQELDPNLRSDIE
jgi:hypothetical protein